MNQLLKSVINQIKPSQDESKEIEDLASELIDKTNNLNSAKFDSMIVGSVAKGTFLKGADIDIFLKFNNDIDNILDDALKKNPLNPSALTLKGLSELEKNNPDLTIEYWNKTLPLLGSQKEKTELIGLIEAVKKRKNQ